MQLRTLRMAEVAMASATAGLLVVALAGCSKPAESVQAATTATTLGNDVDDTVVTARVKSALMADPKTNSYDFKIETRKGDVLLSGFVDSQDQIDQALRTMRAIEGVKSIQNHVALKGATASPGNKLDDGIITGKVKAALLSDSSIQSRDITVVTHIDEVQLSGYVNNQQQMDKAVGIASGVQGVRSVTNQMALKQ